MAEPHTVAEEALKKVAARLECGICLDQYNDPKLLPCFHVFCKQCLERLVQKRDGQSVLQCPNCRRTTALPLQGVSGLQSDFHASHLFEIQDTLAKVKEPQKIQCEKCKKSTATGFCRDCGKFICDKCTEMHQTWEEYNTHEIATIQNVQADAAGFIPPKKKVLYCQKHKDKLLEIYCETCNKLICSNCTIRLHQGHQYDVASDTFTKHKQEITDQLEPIKCHLATVNTALPSFDTRAKEIQDQRETHQADIHKRIDQLQQALEQRRTELIGQLDQLAQQKLKSLAAQRDQVELLHTQLTSCLEYVEGSLKLGTQAEILEMKGSLLRQIKQTTGEFSILAPKEKAKIPLDADSDLHRACEIFAGVIGKLDLVCPEKCYCTGDGIKNAKIGELATFIVHAVNGSDKECQQPVKGLSIELVSCRANTKVKCRMRQVGESKCEVQYQPVTRGQHQLHITIYGKSIKGSPHTVVARPSLQSLGKPVRIIPNLRSPWGITANSKGEIVVAENSGHCITVFTPDGHKIRSFGSQGSAQGQIYLPRGVAVDRDDNIIVMDNANHRIQKFTSEGKFLVTVGTKDSSALQFSWPTGVGINSGNDKVYISEHGNHRIQILNMDLTYSSSFGSRGSGDGQFNAPYDIAFDSINNLYIVDTYNHRIQVFTPDGKFLRKFGTAGSSNGQLNCPYSIAIDGNDTVYVADSGNYRIQVFTPDGKFLRKFGTYGSGDGQLYNPYSIAIDGNDTVYVADRNNHRISVFTTQGQFLRSIGSEGTADGQLQSPRGVAIDKDGFILVSEHGNSRIQMF